MQTQLVCHALCFFLFRKKKTEFGFTDVYFQKRWSSLEMWTILKWVISLTSSLCLTNVNSEDQWPPSECAYVKRLRNSSRRPWIRHLLSALLMESAEPSFVFRHCWLTSVKGAVQGSDWCCIESKLQVTNTVSHLVYEC